MRKLCLLLMLLTLCAPAWAQTALRLSDHTASAVSSTAAFTFPGVTGITLQSWIRYEGGSSYTNYVVSMGTTVANATNGNSSFSLAVGNGGLPTVGLYIGTTLIDAEYNAVSVGWTMTPNVWYHLTAALTFSESGGNGVLRTWLRQADGTLIDGDADGITRIVNMSSAIVTSSARYIVVGGGPAAGTTINSIADVRYWKTALSSATVADNWARRLDAGELADASLVAYYMPVEQGSGDTALEADDSGGPTLTLSGTYSWPADIPSQIAAPPTIPDAPVLSSPSHTYDTISLSWPAVSGATSYKVFRDGAEIASIGTLAHTDTGRTPETLYTYEVQACNSAGCSVDSNTVSVTTNAAPTTFPVVVRPLARGAAFTFDLDDLGLYSTTSYGPWIQPGEARLEWSTDGVDWKRGPDFVRVQSDRVDSSEVPGALPDPRMAAMLFGLSEGVTYHYQVTLSGGSYPDVIPTTGTFTSLTSNPPIGATKTVVTVSESTDSATLQAAVAAAFTGGASHVEIQSASGPGVATKVRATLGVLTQIGTAGAWKRLSVHPDHDVVFDGSTPAYDVIGGGMWSAYTDATKGVDAAKGWYRSATTMTRPWAVRYQKPGESTGILALDVTRGESWDTGTSAGLETAVGGAITSCAVDISANSTRLYVYLNHWPGLTLGDYVTISGTTDARAHGTFKVVNGTKNGFPDGPNVLQLELPAPLASDLNATGGTMAPVGYCSTILNRAALDGAAWVWDSATGYLYLRLHGGVDPNTVQVKIPALTELLDIHDSQYLQVDGLTVQFYGGWGGGIGLLSVDDIVLKNNFFTGTGMIAGAQSNVASRKNRVVIQGNTLIERGLGADLDAGITRPQWSWTKASAQEQIAIDLKGVSVSILDNTIQGPVNGISAGGSMDRTKDQTVYNTYPEAHEYDNNTFIGIPDDAIEPEQWGVNHSYTRNTFIRCYKGVSTAPVIGGPFYILRNKWLGTGEYPTDKQAFLKMGRNDPGDSGYKLVAHNSVVNINADTGGVALAGFANTGSNFNSFFFNNYLAVDNTPIDFNYGGLGYPHEFDYNRYRVARWDSFNVDRYKSFALHLASTRQGEASSGRSTNKNYAGFVEWQNGVPGFLGTPMPGADSDPATIPQTPVTGTLGGVYAYHWLHDPNSTWSEGTNELDPTTWEPLDTTGWPEARVMYGVNTDLGPGWTAFRETVPTVGAVAPPAPPHAALFLGGTEDGTAPGTAASGYVIPASALDGEFTIRTVTKHDEFLYSQGAGSIMPVVRLEDSTGKIRWVLGTQSSPWYSTGFSTGTTWFPGGTVADTGNLYKLAPHIGTYLTTWFVHKPSTATEPGYLRVYRNGAITNRNTSDTAWWDYPIPAGTATAWTGGDMRVIFGGTTDIGPSYAAYTNQRTYVSQFTIWDTALDTGYDPGTRTTADFDAIDQIALSSADALTAHRADILTHIDFRLHDAATGTIPSDEGLDLTLAPSGNARRSDALPPWTGFEPVSDFSPAGTSLTAAATGDTSIRVSHIAAGLGQAEAAGVPVQRRIWVSRGTTTNDAYRYTSVHYARLPSDGSDLSDYDVTVPLAGTTYHVVVEWTDAAGRKTVVSTPVATTGTAAAPSGTRKSLLFSGNASITEAVRQIMPINQPWTIVWWQKRAGLPTQPFYGWSIHDDLYNVWEAKLGYASPTMTVGGNDGDYYMPGATGPSSSDGVWEQWAARYTPNSDRTEGLTQFGRIAGGTVSGGSNPSDAATTRQTDHRFHKRITKLYMGRMPSGTGAIRVAGLSWWTKHMSDAELAELAGKDLETANAAQGHLSDLYYYAGPREDLRTVNPDLGTVIGVHDVDLVWDSSKDALVAWDADYPTLTAFEAGSNAVPVATVASSRGRVGTQIAVTIGATDSDGTIASLTAAVTGPSGAVSHTGDPVAGIDTDTASTTIYFLAAVPGAYTVTATATDDDSETGQAAAASHARRATSTVIVLQ